MIQGNLFTAPDTIKPKPKKCISVVEGASPASKVNAEKVSAIVPIVLEDIMLLMRKGFTGTSNDIAERLWQSRLLYRRRYINVEAFYLDSKEYSDVLTRR